MVRQWLKAYNDPNTNKLSSVLEITENCTNLIRTLPELIHDEINIEDVDSWWEDHAYDALRYWLMYLGINKGNFTEVEPYNKQFLKLQQTNSEQIKEKLAKNENDNNILAKEF